MNLFQTYEKLRQLGHNFASFVPQAVAQSHNEAEFERRVNNEIERLAKRLDVDLLFREQYTLATGRADAVYNRFVIEYEAPEIDRAAARLWGLTDEELADIQASLQELKG
ncbi:MAG: hypothetical protein Kow0063_19040 [Anaerolineae bacterium]